MKKIAVVLSGCGFKDGAEITESVSTLIMLSSQNCDYEVFAPDIEIDCVNHISNDSSGKRNLLVEASRISRGQAKDLKELDANNFDGIVFPGGYGAALHLCNWAQKGSTCDVMPEAEKIIKDFYAQSKPIAAICIAPALIAKVLGPEGVTLTIGNDKETAAEINKTGAEHIDCPVDDYITDRAAKLITTPAYMYSDAKPSQVFKGIEGLIKEFAEMA